jgi:uncharacterized repeat protein (TIGR03843 family)
MLSLDELAKGEVEVLGLLAGSSNYTLLARLTGKSDEERLVVYKPARGEAPLWDFPPSTLYKRETAAFVVSEALGWKFVPPTIVRDGPYGLGAVQAFVHHDPEITAFDLTETHPSDLRRIALFDLVTNNADRKAGHVLLGSEGKIWSVDHGICFHSQYKLRTVVWDFAGEPIPGADCEAIQHFIASLIGETGSRLATLLSKEEIRALGARARKVTTAGVFPLPGPGRSFPWPPV